MRHRKSGRKFNRTSAHRKSMFRNLSLQLINYEKIKTTLPKAKELRRHFEPLITIAKNNNTIAGRRHVFSFLRNNDAVFKLFNELAPRSADRPGGYLRVLKSGFRTGDVAPMAYVLLTDQKQIVEPDAIQAEISNESAAAA